MLSFIEFGKSLSRFVVGAEGNISCRLPGDTFMIKSSGSSMFCLTEDHLVTCDMKGTKVSSNPGRPSMEVGFHSWLYQNTDCKVIAHTHPTNVMKILCGGLSKEFASRRMFPDQVVFNGSEACVVPYATPGEDLVKELSKAVTSYHSVPSLILLDNHGIICCAKDFKQAVTMTEICDKSAEIFLAIQDLKPSYLSQIQISNILDHNSEIYRKSL